MFEDTMCIDKKNLERERERDIHIYIYISYMILYNYICICMSWFQKQVRNAWTICIGMEMRSSWRNTVPVSKVCSSSAFALATWFWWSPEADDLCVFQLKTRGVLGLSMEN